MVRIFAVFLCILYLIMVSAERTLEMFSRRLDLSGKGRWICVTKRRIFVSLYL